MNFVHWKDRFLLLGLVQSIEGLREGPFVNWCGECFANSLLNVLQKEISGRQKGVSKCQSLDFSSIILPESCEVVALHTAWPAAWDNKQGKLCEFSAKLVVKVREKEQQISPQTKTLHIEQGIILSCHIWMHLFQHLQQQIHFNPHKKDFPEFQGLTFRSEFTKTPLHFMAFSTFSKL